MTDAELIAISRAVIAEWEVGGFADDIYEYFAIEVAKRAIAAEREACEQVAKAAATYIPNLRVDDGNNVAVATADKIAAAIRARGNKATESNSTE